METQHRTQEQEYAERVIDGLGGTAATAKLCRISDAAVSQWRDNGIPEYRIDFLKLARPDVFENLDDPAPAPAAQAEPPPVAPAAT